MRCDEETNPLDDNDRKMLFSGTMDLVRLGDVITLPNDSIIEVVNPSFKKQGAHPPCVEEHLPKFVKCPEGMRKKRSLDLNQLSVTPENTLGSVRLGKRQKGVTQYLPEVVVEVIISMMPLKTLARIRCVCKSWHHLIYTKRFVSLHVKNYRTSQLLVGTCSGQDRKCSMHFLPPPPPTGGYSDNDGVSEKIVYPRLFGGSCNGIVCLYNYLAEEDIVVLNPATNEAKKIRKIFVPRKRRSLVYCTVGFGFDPKTNDYKILQMVYGERYPPVARMELYSMRKGSWKKVDCHDFFVTCNYLHKDVACSLPFTDNRIVCALVSPLSGTMKWEILSFDMSSERYEIIAVSPSIGAELGDHECFVRRKIYCKLFPFKETIALGIVHHVGNGSYCNIWILNGGGFNNNDTSVHNTQSRSWSKFLSTNINDGYIVPVGCWGGDQIIFQEYSSRRLLRLDLDLDHGSSNMMVELGGVIPDACVTATQYKESLVGIQDMQDEPLGLPYFLPSLIKGRILFFQITCCYVIDVKD